MIRDESLICEINELWSPVYPFLARHVLEASGLAGGEVLDLGPFAGGVAVEILTRGEGFRAVVQDEAAPVLRWAGIRAGERGVAARLAMREAPLGTLPWTEGRFDLVLVRGAFFFVTPALLREVGRVLHPGGLAWVGGGYGPGTPAGVIETIADRSRRLNADLGKRLVSPAEARVLIEDAGLGSRGRVEEAGGLWIEVRG